ncbi:MAG: DNA-binding transcriptional LysR family regulator [Celeribacter sp.]|jgi:DNA-binding transcriptional LysR family regulator
MWHGLHAILRFMFNDFRGLPKVSQNLSWEDIRIFLGYLRNGSIANAAEDLKISGPTISRRINALQDAIGFPLLNRSNQGLELTHNAQNLVEIWQEAERLLSNAPGLASRMQDNQHIDLRFSTTPALANGLIFPNISSYLERWPSVKLDVDTSYRIVDIGAGQGDVALRFVEPERGAVVRQRVGTLAFNVYCAEGILPDGFEPVDAWQALSETGLRGVTWSPGASVSMPQQKLSEVLGSRRTGIVISDYTGLLDAIKNGIGAGILPDIVGQRMKGVRPVMRPGTVGNMPLWLVTADRLANYRHISEFRDFIRKAVKTETARIATS